MVAASPARNGSAETRVIAIVGAGFSGTAVAIHLLRAARAPLRILLIDPREELGAGVAYATRDYPYPLNVAAAQMSLDPAKPQDFLDYARGTGIHAAPGDYLPRQVYGDYLRARLAEAMAAAAARVTCVHLRASAVQLRNAPGGFDLWLDDGSALSPDQVVLALGNPPPATPRELAGLAVTDRYLRDPWSLGSLAHQDVASVLLVGSGLTMIDAALRLAAIRPRLRHIYVLSRHGWLPQPQATQPLAAINPDVRAALDPARGSTRALVRAFRTQTRAVAAAGGDWREVLALARAQIPGVWNALDARQRARFLRHVRSLWDVHRHRVPAGPLAAVQTLARLGVLEVHAGRLEEANLRDDAVEILWRPRGAPRSRAWLVDRVINCTGPDSCAERSADPLVQSLLANGLIRCDPRSLGIDIASDGRVIGRDGNPVDSLYYLGPWLRARDWEATALPELRAHAAALAARILSGEAARQRQITG
ncbi:MAG TPA: FAD/NAD(P)-binding protein [Steroidobacteraceae bacterium]|nr:FAD/NAD(P)-binding protein [Steroidobacteraceae bacterium]